MKTRAVLAIAVLAAVAVWLGAEQPGPMASTYTDALYGFTIQAPQFPPALPNTGVVAVQMYAPAEQGFAANVHVMVQRVATNRQNYRELSLAQFKVGGLTVNSDTDVTVSGREAIILDYEGMMGDRTLRWLALAVIDTEQVLLVTCTAPKDTFAKYEKEFRACLNSFSVLE